MNGQTDKQTDMSISTLLLTLMIYVYSLCVDQASFCLLNAFTFNTKF